MRQKSRRGDRKSRITCHCLSGMISRVLIGILVTLTTKGEGGLLLTFLARQLVSGISPFRR